MKNKISSKLLLIAILLLAAFLRFYDMDWDQGNHLHPDERFLTMVGNAMKLPTSFVQYLDPQTSLFNPANIDFPFFVYGIFPLVFTKIVALLFATDTYALFVLQGRQLSALADLFVVLLVFKTLKLFEKEYKFNERIKYWGAFFYAIAVLPIQLSHFFAVDTFLNLFLFVSFYTSFKFSLQGKLHNLILSSIFFGLAFASKITCILFLPVILFFLTTFVWKKHLHKQSFSHQKLTQHIRTTDLHHRILYALSFIGIFGIISYLTGRIGDPYLFRSANLLDFQINPLFLQNLEQLKSWNNPNVWFPPGVQWVHKAPILFALQNLIFFGVGIPYFVFILLGSKKVFAHRKNFDLPILFVWVLLFFFYQSIQYSKNMRYFLMIYPFLAIFAAFGFHLLTKRLNTFSISLLLILTLLWPVAFFSIYTKDHSRVTASTWITSNIPSGSTILGEHWDDSLPLRNSSEKFYVLEQLPVFDPDSPEKWEKMDNLLQKGDYYILSSNRGWGSIPTVPEKYPRMTRFYADLFAGKTYYKKIAEFTSYPSFAYLSIPFEIPDDNAEESFTVYDHPKVMIFKNTRKN